MGVARGGAPGWQVVTRPGRLFCIVAWLCPQFSSASFGRTACVEGGGETCLFDQKWQALSYISFCVLTFFCDGFWFRTACLVGG